MDYAYLLEILQAARAQKPATTAEFLAMCAADINAGYHEEVAEALRRYTTEREPNLPSPANSLP